MSKVKCLQIIFLITMQAADLSFHRIFLKTMFMGLKLGVSSRKMSYQERKRVIKLSANIAMAVAGNGMNWSRALIIRHAKHEKNKVLLRSLLGRKRYESITEPGFAPLNFTWQKMIMKRRFRRTNSILRRGAHASNGATARVIARSMAKKRTRTLKSLVPGGESLDDLSLLGETIDYVISLQTQVHLMRLLTEVLSVSNLSPNTKGGIS
ncbi:transcription factor IBH1-like 1 [Dendrobium catenatum]|uniref:transcription factor IBH1-like 1 n=1 Tax=Dendrobium catenatum TaxID=906689 RepID=UPI0009F2E802|nr:transcription factor IBH1-like 1 [Dendrobium catenatum]